MSNANTLVNNLDLNTWKHLSINRILYNWMLKKEVSVHDLDSTVSQEEPVTNCCEYGNETTASIKSGK